MIIFDTGIREFKLEMTIKAIMDYEKIYGKSIYDCLAGLEENKLPSISDIVGILRFALQKYNHGIDEKRTIEIFEEWLETKKKMPIDFVTEVLIDIYKDAGLISIDNEEEITEETDNNMFRD